MWYGKRPVIVGIASAITAMGLITGPIAGSAQAAPPDPCSSGQSRVYNVVADYSCIWVPHPQQLGEFQIQVDVGNQSIEQVRVRPVRIELQSTNAQQSLAPIQLNEDGVVLARNETRVFRVNSRLTFGQIPFSPQVRLILSVTNPDGTHVGELASPWMTIEPQGLPPMK